MAPKQHTIDFIINAVLNGGFSAVFTKAQQEFIRLGGEIKNLQAIQRDVKAYEKQAAAVQHTTDRLENLRKQMESIEQQKGFLKKQIEETEKAGQSTAELKGKLAELEREKLKLEQKIASTTEALGKQDERLKSTKDRLEEAGVSTDNLAGKDEELKKKIEELTEEQKKATEGAVGFGDKSAAAIEAVGGAIAAAGIVDAMGKIKDSYLDCVEVAGDFEQAMSAVEAIANSNNSEMAAMTAEAKELGATTVFTAQQSANAMEYMAMAGWDASEMLSGMKGMTTLAAAAGEDLAQVSDIVTDNLTAFGLTAADTAHFADVLAAAAANSNTNISIMGDTFKNSSSVAGALGYSIEDVAVMVGLMANNAVKGSRAGTALRNIFNGLLGGVTLTAEAFGELDYSAVQSDGSMKGLMETVEDLRGYFDQMTEAEKVNNAMTIAGMRGYNGLLAVLNATDQDFQSLYASVNNCTGAAERMASVKLDNLNGDITLANSAMEALQATIGEQFNPELRELTQLKTELLNGLNDFIIENPALVKGVMAAVGAFGLMETAVLGANAAMRAFQALNLGALLTTAGPALAVAGGIAAVAGAAFGLNEALRDGRPVMREATEAARDMRESINEAGTTYEETARRTLATAEAAGIYIGKLEEIEAAEGENAAQSQEYHNILALLSRTVPELADRIDLENNAIEGGTDALRRNTEEWKKNAEARAYQEYINSLYDQYGEVIAEAAENNIKLTEAQIRRETAEKSMNAAKKRMVELEKQGIETGSEAQREYLELESAVNGYWTEIVAADQEIETFTKAVEKDTEAIAEAEEEMSLAEKAWKELLKQLGLYTDEEENLPGAEAAVRKALDGTMASVQALTEAYADAYDEALKSFSGQFGLFDEAKADAEATVAAAQAALDTQLSYWQNYAANIAALKEISAEGLGVTQENYNTLMEYVRSGTPEAAGLAADMVKAVNDGNTQALTDLANTLGEISESQAEAAGDVAEWTTGLNKQMNQLIQDMEEEIAALDMSADAAESGRATIQAYIDAADDMLPQVQSAYARVASRARLALSNALAASYQTYDSYYDAGFGGYNPALGFAVGTDNAPPGWSWVGEEGPELIRMRGGEQVLPNSVSRKVAESYSEYSRYTAAQGVQQTRPALEVAAGGQTSSGTKMEMHFHIEAGASPETVGAWQSYANSGELRATILEVMEDAQADTRRRTLA